MVFAPPAPGGASPAARREIRGCNLRWCSRLLLPVARSRPRGPGTRNQGDAICVAACCLRSPGLAAQEREIRGWNLQSEREPELERELEPKGEKQREEGE